MQLTGKEINRNNRISLGVTIFSFIVLLLFLMFKNIITSKPSFASRAVELNMQIQTGRNYDFNNEKKAAALYTGRQEESKENKVATVSDEDISTFNSMTKELLQKYKDSRGKTIAPATGADTSGLRPGNEILKKEAESPQIGFDLSKRKLVSRPEYGNNNKEEGKVIVDIVVDKYGNVIEADPNGRGTTTSSALLKEKAKQMATLTKFSLASGIEEQKGSITIIFSFN